MADQEPRIAGRAQPPHRGIASRSRRAPTAPCWAKGRSAPTSPSSASSRATRKIAKAGPSSARPASCSTARCREAGIDRTEAYVTNAVKHFKFEPRGKRRLHKKPNRRRGEALSLVADEGTRVRAAALVVALGGTAAAGLTGKPLSVMKVRGPMRVRRAVPATSPCIRPICCACPTRPQSGRPPRLSGTTSNGSRLWSPTDRARSS